MEPYTEPKCVMIVAGEASGDLHGSRLVRKIREKNHDLFFFGIGGHALKQAGVRILVDASELSVVGITEVFSKISVIRKAMAIGKRLLKSLRPDLLILIDFPDFNLHLAGTAKKCAIPVLYYISPQIWAWRPGRVKKIRKCVDHMAVILPFEEAFYRKYNVPATFVGHPLLETDLSFESPIFRREADPAPIIGLLPGSRNGEVSRHLPVMLEAAKILSRRMKNVQFLISLAPSIEKNNAKAIIQQTSAGLKFELETGDVRNVFEKTRIVVAASGTVTLEAAISGVPMVIVYKVSQLSYWLGRAMIKIKNICLVNIIAGKQIAPELVQNDASPEKIADRVDRMLSDPIGLERMRNELLGIRNLLGQAGASERTAELAVNMLKKKKLIFQNHPRIHVMPFPENQKRSDGIQWRLAGIFGKMFIDLLFSTIRTEFIGLNKVESILSSKRFIFAFWHSRILLISYLYQDWNGVILVSASKDGEFIARVLQRQGHETIRGSTRRGGARALAAQIRKIREKPRPGAVIPDGPTGPRFIAQPGVIILAKKTGLPIIPVTYSAKRMKIFASWDRFILPYPFTKCRIVYGDPVYVSKDADEYEEEKYRIRLEMELCRITSNADRYFGHLIT